MRYWLLKDRKSEGPFTAEALVALADYDPGCLVCPEDRPSSERSNWTPARKHPEILAAMRAGSPLARPSESAPPSPSTLHPPGPSLPELPPFAPKAEPPPPPFALPPPPPGPRSPELPPFAIPPAQAPAAAPLMTPVPVPAREAPGAAPPPVPVERRERMTLALLVLLALSGVIAVAAGIYALSSRTGGRADEISGAPASAHFPKDSSPPPLQSRPADTAAPAMKEPAAVGGKGGPLEPSR